MLRPLLRAVAPCAFVLSLALPSVAAADTVVPDDQVVQGSICAGPACVNNENFGFDTLRLKGTDLRLAFVDTSASAGFASNDWEIAANDLDGVGSENYFALRDTTAGTSPFRIMGGAPTGSLVVRGDGSVLLQRGAIVQRLDVTTTSAPGTIDRSAVLTALRSLPIGTYQFAADPANTRHIGPLAGDFNSAFGVGSGTTYTSLTDQAGIALVAAQALEAKVRDLKGATGPQGATGPRGADGAPGVNGRDGRDGVDGTGVSQATLDIALARLTALERSQAALRKRNETLAASVTRLERQLRVARRAAAGANR